MHYVYILKSLIDERVYVGFSSDLRERLIRHNTGKVKSTKAYRPWRLVYYEAYANKLDATMREKQLKMHAVKEKLVRRLQKSLVVG
ncbi:MAG: GIY-YIG nuclease family protein [Patescibacteria group bacterium]